MIHITLFKSGKYFKAFEISGHSGYSEQGSDIVCAAVSSVANNAVVGICEVLDIPASVKIDEKKGYLKCTLLNKLNEKQTEGADVLILSMQKSLEYIQNDYKKYVTLEVKNEI